MKTLIRRGLVPTLVATWLFAASAKAATLAITPSVVSNTYSGTVTLLVTGLTNGETVIVQKYMDVNGDGIVDAGDILCQQFKMRDGKPNVFLDGATTVTNLATPCDLDSVTGQITASIIFPLSGFEQTIVEQYLYVLSSPVGSFSPVTNSFTVTNFSFGQSISGSITAGGTNVPNAAVLLFQPAGKNFNPEGGIRADNSGNYSFSAPPGNYILVAFKSNFVASVGAAAVTLGSGSSVSTNLAMMPATTSISGSIIDASNSTPALSGSMLSFITKNTGLLTVAFADTNGNFNAPLTSDTWQVQIQDGALGFHGYLRSQNKLQVDTTTGAVAGASIALPKANALFYGSVKTAQNQPMSFLSISSSDQGGFEQDPESDVNGNYFAGALSSPTDTWQVQVGSDTAPANYIFSSPAFDFNSNGGTNLTPGQAVLVNIVGLQTTNVITGRLQDSHNNPITNVQIFASATISNVDFNTQANSDGGGNYSLPAGNGVWNVNVNCQGGNNSLDYALGAGNYQCPATQFVGITNNNGTANFTVQPCGGIQIYPASPLPGGTTSNYYSIQFNAESCSGNFNFNWSFVSGTLPPGMTLYSGGAFNGTPTTNGTFNFTVNANDGNGSSTNVAYSLTISNPIPAQPSLSSPAYFSDGRFQMFVTASPGQNYSVQMSTNLVSTNWLLLLITNPSSSSFFFQDAHATNRSRFYRVIPGP